MRAVPHVTASAEAAAWRAIVFRCERCKIEGPDRGAGISLILGISGRSGVP